MLLEVGKVELVGFRIWRTVESGRIVVVGILAPTVLGLG